MTRSAIPSSSSASYDETAGMHTHPVPRVVRWALASIVAGLILLVLFVVFVYTTNTDRLAARTRLDCLQRRNSAIEARTQYDAILAPLQQVQDPAIAAVRDVLVAARSSADRATQIPCR